MKRSFRRPREHFSALVVLLFVLWSGSDVVVSGPPPTPSPRLRVCTDLSRMADPDWSPSSAEEVSDIAVELADQLTRTDTGAAIFLGAREAFEMIGGKVTVESATKATHVLVGDIKQVNPPDQYAISLELRPVRGANREPLPALTVPAKEVSKQFADLLAERLEHAGVKADRTSPAYKAFCSQPFFKTSPATIPQSHRELARARLTRLFARTRGAPDELDALKRSSSYLKSDRAFVDGILEEIAILQRRANLDRGLSSDSIARATELLNEAEKLQANELAEFHYLKGMNKKLQRPPDCGTESFVHALRLDPRHSWARLQYALCNAHTADASPMLTANANSTRAWLNWKAS